MGKLEQITLFKTDLYATSINVNNNDIVKYLKKLDKDAIVVNNQSNHGGWHSHFYFDPFPSCLDPVNDKINKFMKETMHKDFLIRGDLCVHNSWILINKKGNFNKPRKHPPYTFTGLYFVNSPKDSGDLIFNNQAEMNNYAVDYKKFNAHNSKEFTISPRKGDLLIWPAWIETYITPNLTNAEKIMYGFNI